MGGAADSAVSGTGDPPAESPTIITENNPLDEDDHEGRGSVDSGDDGEIASLLPKGMTPTKAAPGEVETWHGRAQMITVCSLIFNLAVFIISMMAAVALNSGSLLSLATEALIDVIDDCVVLWRFWCDPHDPMQDRYDAQAAVLVALIVILSSSLSIANALVKLAITSHPKTRTTLVAIVGVIALVSIVMATVKFIIASKVRSQALLLDAYMTTSVAFISIAYLITAALNFADEGHTWWLDGIVALIVCSLLMVYAVRVLCKYPGFHKMSFWDLPFKLQNTPPGTPPLRSDQANNGD